MLLIRSPISPLEFKTGIGVAVPATLETEQPIPHTRTAIIDTITFPQGSEGDIIPVSEMHESLTKICDILDRSVSKWVVNTVHILAYLFISASVQCHRVWASQF